MSDKTFTLPSLYCHAKHGKVKQWDIAVEPHPDGTASINSWAGFTEGKKSLSTTQITDGKNIGRSNETTPYDQAVSEAKSKWEKKKDSGYVEHELEPVEEGEAQEEGKYPLPMLANKYLECVNDVTWPMIGQTKLNGIRGRSGIVDGEFSMWSRKAKLYPVMMDRFRDEVLPILEKLSAEYPDVNLDGEFYCHGLALQNIASGVKKLGEFTDRIKYNIYDIAGTGLSQHERTKLLKKLLGKLPKDSKLVLVDSFELGSEEEAVAALEIVRAKKFEGLMLRGWNGVYVDRHRSDDLLKFKVFIDEEYEIVGGQAGTKGREKGAVIFKCKTKKGQTFDVRPTGTMEQRQQWMKELDSFIGKLLTVRYQDLSNDGVPTILSGRDAEAIVRDYE